ncbi:AAA family ATPase [Rhodobacteraceae bacterium N5(2021)]|uniref:AAA family ATPase n=1 Tax=Gymnodinialimonas phycosphaerae TaxID=2841589 RepID=A0A975TVR0_9RHOB|nr:AAA family ATPase [Gymnodinialimonas phycosphaerae]MBY4895037.1 AAA family ATPase [Gymnodinialimonas phycosphaerae]
MSSGLALHSEPAPIVACTVSSKVHHFGLLIEDMETEVGEAWGDLGFDEAREFINALDVGTLEFIALAVREEDEADLGRVGEVINAAHAKEVAVILIPENLSTAGLRELLRLGADDFVPYPLAEGALHDAIEKIARAKQPPPAEVTPLPVSDAPATGHRMDGNSAIFAVQNLAGGTGATTLAVNLAWELAHADKKNPPSVCVLDLDLQHGSVATYLDLPRRDIVLELLQDATTMDTDGFKQALVHYGDKLSVFTTPAEIVPLDLVGPDEVNALIDLASQCFDIVVIDMPRTMVMWTDTVLTRADVFFTTLELDLRSAQNAMRFIKACRSEDLPLEKMHYVLNRAPGLTDLNGKNRMKKMADSLGVSFSTQLPDGGKPVMQAGDNGETLAEAAKKNPLRKEIMKLSDGLYKAMASEARAKG